jgi:DNA polymerase III epsilon subunit-like protein
MRYLCVDFETNGFSTKCAPNSDWTLPFSSYPIQISVEIVEDGQIYHAYDTLIKGAIRLAPWVKENVPFTLEDLQNGETFENVLAQIDALIQDGDTIVAHNVNFDIGMVIGRTAKRLGINSHALTRILELPRFCTMRCLYVRGVFGRCPKLFELCNHFEVPLENAHDATADSRALACCVAEAMRRGVMITHSRPIEAFVHKAPPIRHAFAIKPLTKISSVIAPETICGHNVVIQRIKEEESITAWRARITGPKADKECKKSGTKTLYAASEQELRLVLHDWLRTTPE